MLLGGVPALPAQAEEGPKLQELLVQMQALQAQQKEDQQQIETLKHRVQELEAGQLSNREAASLRGKGVKATLSGVRIGETVAALEEPQNGGGAPAPGEAERKTPAPSQSEEAVAQQQQGRFGDRFGLELGTAYSHFDNARINLNGFLALDAIFLGRISIQGVRADIMTTDLTARFSPSRRLQFDIDVPYLFRRTVFQSGGAGGSASGLAEKTVTQNGFGDISAGATFRLLTESAHRPDLVLSARIKAPTGKNALGAALLTVPGTQENLVVPTRLATGTGVWAVSIGASVLKTLDPLVLFGSINYFHNFQRHFPDIDEAPGLQPGEVRLGDALQYGFGAAFALNDRSSLNMSYTQRFVRHSRLRPDGKPFETIVGSEGNVALVNLGGTFLLTDRLTLIPTVSIGLTQDSPNFIVGVRLPYRF